MAKKSTEEKKPEYPTPRLSWAETHETNSAPLDGESLYLVCAVRLNEAPSRHQKGQKVYVSNGVVPVGYASAAPGQVFTENQMIIQSDDEDLLKERRAAAKETVARLLREKAIVEIGTVEATSMKWWARLSDEGRRIVEDIEAWLAIQLKTVEGRKIGDEVDTKGEDIYLVAKGASLPIYGRRDSPLGYPALVAASVFDEGYRPDPDGQRAAAIKQSLEAGTIHKAGRVFPVEGENPNVLTGRRMAYRLELDKEVREELEALAEAAYWQRLAAWKARGEPGFDFMTING